MSATILAQVPHLLADAVAATGPGPCVFLSRKTRPTHRINGRMVHASRAVWMIANGDPGDLHVLHTCGRGTQGCVRIGHLKLGTHADNMRDMVADGASTRGERQPGSKLTETDVRRIRAMGQSGHRQRDIAAAFGIDQSNVSLILTGRTWRHVGGGA